MAIVPIMGPIELSASAENKNAKAATVVMLNMEKAKADPTGRI